MVHKRWCAQKVYTECVCGQNMVLMDKIWSLWTKGDSVVFIANDGVAGFQTKVIKFCMSRNGQFH
jgi:hypothetical protein